MTLSSPCTYEAYHKALVEKLNKPVLVRRSTLPTRPSTQVAYKAPQFSGSASNAKTLAFPLPLTHPCLLVLPEPQLIRSCSVLVDRGEVINLYASECPHHTFASEHEPIDCEDEIVEFKGRYEDLVDVENSLLQGDSHIGAVMCLLSNPFASEYWKRTIF